MICEICQTVMRHLQSGPASFKYWHISFVNPFIFDNNKPKLVDEGQGQVANKGYKSPYWVNGKMELLGENTFRFVWLAPINQIVSFHRIYFELFT